MREPQLGASCKFQFLAEIRVVISEEVLLKSPQRMMIEEEYFMNILSSSSRVSLITFLFSELLGEGR